MTHTEFLKLLEERPMRLTPQPEPPPIPAESRIVAAKVHQTPEDHVTTGAVVLLVALVFWTTYFWMARLTG